MRMNEKDMKHTTEVMILAEIEQKIEQLAEQINRHYSENKI